VRNLRARHSLASRGATTHVVAALPALPADWGLGAPAPGRHSRAVRPTVRSVGPSLLGSHVTQRIWNISKRQEKLAVAHQASRLLEPLCLRPHLSQDATCSSSLGSRILRSTRRSSCRESLKVGQPLIQPMKRSCGYFCSEFETVVRISALRHFSSLRTRNSSTAEIL
jgi:hypothetical protein